MMSSPDSDSYEPQHEFDSPFLNETVFTDEAAAQASQVWELRRAALELESPFLNEFEIWQEATIESEFEEEEELYDELEEEFYDGLEEEEFNEESKEEALQKSFNDVNDVRLSKEVKPEIFQDLLTKKKEGQQPKVVFLAGLMGSKLSVRKPSGKLDVIWDPPRFLGGIDLTDIKKEGNGFNDSGNVMPTGIIQFGRLYEDIIKELKLCSELLEFSYDWRLSNSVNAKRLRQTIISKWPKLARDHKEEKITIITHSMGGLLSRYFIEELQGYKFVKRLIAVGTPHIGVPEALIGLRLIHRTKQKIFLNRFSSIMELLPVYDFIHTQTGEKEKFSQTYKNLFNRIEKGALKSKLRDFMKENKMSINDLITSFRKGLINDPEKLNGWLKNKNIQYVFIGSTGLKTIQGFQGKIKIMSKEGDGTVPLKSALWHPILKNQSNIKRIQFDGILHRRMFKDELIQKTCVDFMKSVSSDYSCVKPQLEERELIESETEACATLPISHAPIPCRFYTIKHKIDTKGLIDLAERAYAVNSNKLKLAQWINDHPYNQRFWRKDNASEGFPKGRISFNPRFSSDISQQANAIGLAPRGNAFATIFIPPPPDWLGKTFPSCDQAEVEAETPQRDIESKFWAVEEELEPELLWERPYLLTSDLNNERLEEEKEELEEILDENLLEETETESFESLSNLEALEEEDIEPDLEFHLSSEYEEIDEEELEYEDFEHFSYESNSKQLEENNSEVQYEEEELFDDFLEEIEEEIDESAWRMRPPVRYQANRYICWAEAISSWSMVTRGVKKFKLGQDVIGFFKPLGVVNSDESIILPEGMNEAQRFFGLKFKKFEQGNNLSGINWVPMLRHSHLIVIFQRPGATYFHFVVVYGVDRFHICFMDPELNPDSPSLDKVKRNRVCARLENFGAGADKFWVFWKA